MPITMIWMIVAYCFAWITIAIAGWFFGRMLFNRWLDKYLFRLLKDSYRENIWALIVGVTRMTPTVLFEVELRSEVGELLERPLGSAIRESKWGEISFNPAQWVKRPLGPKDEVDTEVVIGPKSDRPLKLRTPIIPGAMSYAIGVSKKFSLAMAKGAGLSGTAFNSGSGPVLPELFDLETPLIMQYAGGDWSQQPELLTKADMIEIRLGHGARVALGREIKAKLLPKEARELLHISLDDSLVMNAGFPELSNLDDLKSLVSYLRSNIQGGPVGFKLVATQNIENEMIVCLEAGADFIAIDGAEGGTSSTPPIIADDFGIPTAHALVRAVKLLDFLGMRDNISLVVSGGLRTPGEMLKVMALGANAVYCGTAVMMATTHGQLSKSVPFEPITTMVWASGKNAEKFNIDKGAQTLANFIKSSTLEMAEAARALGKSSLRQINREDLVARTKEAAELFELPLSWWPSS